MLSEFSFHQLVLLHYYSHAKPMTCRPHMAQHSPFCGCPLPCTTTVAALPLSSPPTTRYNNAAMSNLHHLGWNQDTGRAQWHMAHSPSPEQTTKPLGKAASCTAHSDPESLISSCPCKYTVSFENRLKRCQVVSMLITALCHREPDPWREITPHGQSPNAFHLVDFTNFPHP